VSRERLDHLVRRHQATHRVPSLSAALLRDGEPAWETAVGLADADGAEATPRHRYRVGSITKTFTAAAVMQLVADGAVGLDDPLSEHLPEHAEAAVTVRRMLAHVSGMQREVPGDAWQTLEMPAVDELLRGLADVEQVLPAGERWHYSNLAYSLLGELVSRRRGAPYREVVQGRLLGPAGMTETGFEAAEPFARGYFVRPYTDELVPQPDPPLRGFEPAGGLMSTAADLSLWAAAFLDPDRGVLDKATVDRMHLVHAMVDHERWTLGWGLGLELHRRGERLLAGHSGAMPGYLAQLVWSRADRVACAVLSNSGASGDPAALAVELLEAELGDRPAGPPAWRPGEGPPPELASALGRWWTEGMEFVAAWRDGHLEFRAADAPAHKPPAVLEREGADAFRVASGREHGERLVMERDADGAVTRMLWAGYELTRDPDPFTGPTPSP
jgi:CubicO group peptidase (beta-lactamase class C family)